MSNLPDEFKVELEHLNMISGEIFKESDRAAAVLVGAELDRYLHILLNGYLRPASKKDDRLLAPDGPLGSFSSRIEMIYRMGLIPDMWHHDLNLLRKIRNEFAHGPVGLTFDKQPVSNFTASLQIAKDSIAEMKVTANKELKLDSKSEFMLTASVLLAQMKLLRFNALRLPESWKNFSRQMSLHKHPDAAGKVEWPDFGARLTVIYGNRTIAGVSISQSIYDSRGDQ